MQTDVKSSVLITHKWKRWIAENKLLDLEESRIIEILIQNGIEASVATEEVRAVASNPYFQVGDWMAQRLKKLESLLSIYRDLSALSSGFGKIERRSNLSREEFLEEYYSANRPVILLDLMQTWKALSLWNPEYLKHKCGNEIIEVMTGRETDMQYEQNSQRHKNNMSFGDYVDLVTSTDQSNDFYLVANNHFLEREGMQWVLNDIEVFPAYLDNKKLAGSVFFWFGPAGTITPLHHDAMNIFMAQVYGRKRVILVPSSQTHLVYNNMGVYSEVDCDNPDSQKYPLFQRADKIEVVLEPGEVLFLPVGWWHYVKALDVSITVTFTNFLFPNHYHWRHPHINR
jgi:Cupin-like domain